MTEPIVPTARVAAGSSALYRAALGPLNVERYLAVFGRFDAAGRRGLVWHGPAALFTLGWLVLRRLWGAALIYALLLGGLAGFGLLGGAWVAGWAPGVRYGLLVSLLLCFFLVPGWLGYALVHRQVQRRILSAVTQARTLADARTALQAGGVGPDRLRRVLTGFGLLLSGLLFLGAWQPWLPAFEPPEAAAPVPAAPAPAPLPPAPAPAPVTIAEPEPLPMPAAVRQPAAPAAPVHGVNVGLFASPDNAQRAHQRLLQAQLPATVEVLRNARGERFRVRVGPFADAAAAEAAAQRVRELGLEAVVFRAP